MSSQQPLSPPDRGDVTSADAPEQSAARDAYASLEEPEGWREDLGELPPRPRRRLLSPAPLALLAVLLIACGFIGGVLVEKGQTSSATTGGGGGIAARFAALRSGASGASTAGAGGTAGAAFAGRGGLPTSAGRGTVGQVAYASGDTLYVTTSEGNTVKVSTSPATTVSKTVSASVKGIHPGETVTVTGTTAKNGSVSAESIRVGSSLGGLAALFGGGGASAAASSSATGSSGGAGGSSGAGGASAPALFGNGG